MLYTLAKASLSSRKTSALLTVFSIAVSVFILLAVQHSQSQLKASFKRTVSGVDLIVGSRTAPINLLLYSVFRIGDASNNLSWQSYQQISQHKQVDWSVPIALGDSHKGYRVMGTSRDYFLHYKYADKQQLQFQQGQKFQKLYEVVLGAEVAKKLGYQLGQKLVLAHGTGHVSFSKHSQHPFEVVGILKATGTAIDQTLHISMQGIEVIHEFQKTQTNMTLDDPQINYLQPKNLTAFMLGFKSKMSILLQQRNINQYGAEPLTAIIPGVALSELWRVMSMVENLLSVIAILVLIAALLGMATMLLASMNERQREIALIRAVGAGAGFIFVLIQLEALLLTLGGIFLGYFGLSLALLLSQSWISSEFGLFISPWLLSEPIAIYLGGTLLLASLMAFIPGLNSYRAALHNALTSR